MPDHDVVVVGGGAAGLAAARSVAQRGKKAALVSDGPLGGDCTFTGCVPSKTLIEAAAAGVSAPEAFRRVREAVARIAATETADVLRAEGVDAIEGRGHLSRGVDSRWTARRSTPAGSCSPPARIRPDHRSRASTSPG